MGISFQKINTDSGNFVNLEVNDLLDCQIKMSETITSRIEGIKEYDVLKKLVIYLTEIYVDGQKAL